MSAILGLRDVESLDSDARPGFFEEEVYKHWKDHRVFQALTSRLGGRRKVTDPEFTVFEQDVPGRRFFINDAGNYDADDTVLTVDDGAGTSGCAKYFRAGMVVVVGGTPASGELLIVAEDPSSATQITVLRGQLDSTADAILNNAALTILHDASAEGGNVPGAVTEEPVARTNYIGVIQTPWYLTEMMGNTKTKYGQNEANRQRGNALWQHSLDVELALLYGRKAYKTDATSGTRVRTTGGLAYWMTAAGINTLDASSTNFTTAAWYAFIEAITEGSAQKVFLLGQTLYSSLHKVAREEGSIQITAYANKYGFSLERMKSAGPELLLARHPLLTKLFPGDGFILDLPMLRYYYMLNTTERNVILGDNVLTQKKVFVTEPGLRFVHPRAFGYVYGNTTHTPAAA